MSIRGLKRATLLLTLSSVILCLLLKDTTLDCDEEMEESRRVIEKRFRRAVARQKDPEEFCSQTIVNSSHSVSLLGLGSVELGPHHFPEIVRDTLQRLNNEVDVVAWTLANPLLHTSFSETLSILRGGQLGLVSLATELMSASGEDSIKRTTHTLGEAGLHWLGLAMRSGNVLTVNGLRIGVLAYCAVYKECVAIMNTPYSPVRYSSKTAATDIKSLKSRGAEVIVVMVRWGRGANLLPDETALVTARYLSSLGVTLILGDHPVLQQNHAYFDDTLVIFSPGSFIRHFTSSHLCWKQRLDGVMEYTMTEECQSLHPKLHSTLLNNEQHTTLYKIFIHRSLPAVAKFVSVPLIEDGSGLQLPHLQIKKWTTLCSTEDLNCLTCHTF